MVFAGFHFGMTIALMSGVKVQDCDMGLTNLRVKGHAMQG
jgi:hypothetical protein